MRIFFLCRFLQCQMQVVMQQSLLLEYFPGSHSEVIFLDELLIFLEFEVTVTSLKKSLRLFLLLFLTRFSSC